MDKIKKIFSPGHEKDEEIMYNDPNNTSSSTSAQHGTEQPVSSTAKSTDLRHNVLDPQSNINSRPNPTAQLSSASAISDDVSTASIRSGVVGAGQAPGSVEGTGFTDHATGLSAQQTMPVRSVTPTGNPRPKASQMETMDPKGFVTSSHQHKGEGHNFKGDPCPPGDEPLVPGYPHHYKGPHGTDTANKLDPHVPGEFPSGDGFDAHESGRNASLTTGTTDAASDAYAAQQRTGALPGQDMNTTESNSGHHYGRDAALGAGAGAAGVGAYETLKHHEHTSDSNALGQGSQPDNFNATSSPVAPQSTTERSFPLTSHPTSAASTTADQPTLGGNTSETSRDHHLGRDAALVGGGLGAAGLGAHELGSHRHSREIEGYDDQRFDPAAASGDKSTRIPNLMYGTSNKPTHSGQSDSNNYGRDAALAAGGVGAAGAAGSQLHGYNHGGSTETDPASKTIGPHKSNAMNILDPRVQPEPEKMKDRTTAGPYQSDMLNRADPRVDSDLSQQNKEHHYGRDAALAGGAGAAGVGAYEYGKHNNPASSTTGSHPTNTANVVDPRVQANHAPITDRSVDPAFSQQNKEHHYGRDAGLAAGAGTAGVGAYEYGKHHGGPADNLGTSTFDPRSTNTTNVVDPSTDPTLAQQSQGHHYGRDAAVAGGAGAAGVGAYEYSKHRNAPAESNLRTSTFDPRSTNTTNVVDPATDPTLAQQNQGHHYGRDAAIAGGVGAAGYGAHEALDPKEQEKLAKHQAKEAEKAEKAQQHQIDKDLKHQQKEGEHEIAKQEKSAAKDREHEQKKLAAAAAAAHEKEEKKHKHELEKAEKQREKEADKSEKEAEKATKENEHPEKKHHGLLGFLHRDKKSEPEEPLRQQGRLQEADIAAHERHQRELEAAAAGGQVHAAGAKFEPPLEEQRQHPLESAPQYVSIDEKGHQHVSTDPAGRHRLHKDPPASVLKERGVDPDEQSYGSGSGNI